MPNATEETKKSNAGLNLCGSRQRELSPIIVEMPKSKQPDPLQKMSLGVLLRLVVRYADELSATGSLEDFCRGISIMKKNIFNYVPWFVRADFCTKFLDDYCATDRQDSMKKAILEILKDVETADLRFRGSIIAHLDPNDAPRFQRLVELDLTHFPSNLSIDLGKFYLNDLTTFVFPDSCTDRDLIVIGENCPKLEILKVRESEVTDEGLRALSQCLELRVVDIVDCPVSYTGINNLLAVNNKIEEFAHWDGTGHDRGSDILSHLDSSVCPSITRFVYEYERDDRSVDLKTVISKFPNLIDLKINCIDSEDLSILRSLGKLTKLELYFVYDMYYDEIEVTWGNLKSLLNNIGSNLLSLKLSCWDQGFIWGQEDLEFIFDACPNIECLSFDQGGGLVLIPPFQKLKQLYPRIPIEFEQIEILDDPELDFGHMPSLETLSVINYGMKVEDLESLILDNTRFPNLSVIETNCMKQEDLDRLEQLAKTHNLDFKIQNDPTSNWYVEYKSGNGSEGDHDGDNNIAE